jgi:hypothetical protein
MSSEFGYGIRSAQIPATKLVVFQPFNRIPVVWLDLARTSRPAGRIDLARISLPERPNSSDSGKIPASNFGRNPVTFAVIWPLSPESGQPRF